MGDLLSKVVSLKRITDEGLEAEPPAAGGHGPLGTKPQPLGIF